MKKIRWTTMAVVGVLLITGIAAGLRLAAHTETQAGTLRIYQGKTCKEVVLASFAEEPISGTLRNGKGEEQQIEGTGVLLSSLLRDAGVTAYDAVTVTADDAYSAVVYAEEIDAGDRVYLMPQDDGIRLLVFGDSNSKRSVTDVVSITVS